MIDKNKKLYIAGHTGMVGSALLRKFSLEGFSNILTRDLKELDLRKQSDVESFFEKEKPEYVIVAAAKVGGILANNTYRAEFIYDNLMIEANIIHSAYKYGCEKLIFLGSSCIYPKLAPQPLKEEYLLSGYLEETNEPYAIAKISGIKMCESYYKQYGSNFYSVMPTNMYGPNDNFNLNTSHVLPALLRKFHEAKSSPHPASPKGRGEVRGERGKENGKSDKEQFVVSNQQPEEEKLKTENSKLNTVEVWGTGTPRREFMHVDDLAGALYFLLNEIDAKEVYEKGITHLNIGTGLDLTIGELAELVKKVVGTTAEIVYDTSKPDGTPQKLMDVSRINKLGWKADIGLEEGIKGVYKLVKGSL